MQQHATAHHHAWREDRLASYRHKNADVSGGRCRAGTRYEPPDGIWPGRRRAHVLCHDPIHAHGQDARLLDYNYLCRLHRGAARHLATRISTAHFARALLFNANGRLHRSVHGVHPLHPTALPAQVATMLLSLAITAFGVSLVVNMGVVPNAPDGLVQVIAEKLKRRFGDVKVMFDCSHVAASLTLSLVCMHNLGGFGVTTAISALFLGHIINFANKLFAQRFVRMAFGAK